MVHVCRRDPVAHRHLSMDRCWTEDTVTLNCHGHRCWRQRWEYGGPGYPQGSWKTQHGSDLFTLCSVVPTVPSLDIGSS